MILCSLHCPSDRHLNLGSNNDPWPSFGLHWTTDIARPLELQEPAVLMRQMQCEALNFEDEMGFAWTEMKDGSA